jgi:hypothetical protein
MDAHTNNTNINTNGDDVTERTNSVDPPTTTVGLTFTPQPHYQHSLRYITPEFGQHHQHHYHPYHPHYQPTPSRPTIQSPHRFPYAAPAIVNNYPPAVLQSFFHRNPSINQRWMQFSQEAPPQHQHHAPLLNFAPPPPGNNPDPLLQPIINNNNPANNNKKPNTNNSQVKQRLRTLVAVNKKQRRRRHSISTSGPAAPSAVATGWPPLPNGPRSSAPSLPPPPTPTQTANVNLPNNNLLYDQIDQWHGGKTWSALASRTIRTTHLFHIVQLHAFLNSQVQKIQQDTNKCGSGIRVFKCVGEGCPWSIKFRATDQHNTKNHTWKMDDTFTNDGGSSTGPLHLIRCECQSSSTGIPGSILVNLPAFHDFVRDSFVPTALSRPKTVVALLKAQQIHVRFSNGQYSKCKAAVTKYIMQVIVPREYARLPAFLHRLASKNKNLTVALQSEANTNSFFRLFLGFPIALEVGELTMDVLVTDCFHQKCKSYDGVVMHIVSRTGFGRTVLCAIAIIPIEDTNHISWVIQMCWRHGIELKCGLFTDQGPLLSAASTLFEKFKIKLKLQLCLQHIIRCIRAMFPSLFQRKKKNNNTTNTTHKTGRRKKKEVTNDKILRRSVHEASYCPKVSVFFIAIEQMVKQLVETNPTNIVDCIGVGTYLLDLHPHLWTVIANAKDFVLKDDYQSNHRDMYTNFLLCKNLMQELSATKNPNELTAAELDTILGSSRIASKADFRAKCHQPPHELQNQFKFKNIVSDSNPAPRYHNSKTNIAEMFGNLMKLNGARYKNPVRFLHHALRLYNMQVQQLKRDFKKFNSTTLTTIGSKIQYMTGKNYRMSYNRGKMLDHTFDDDGDWTSIVGNFSTTNSFIDTYEASLSWGPHGGEPTNNNNVFRHSCAEHVHMSDMLRCPCHCIFILCNTAFDNGRLPVHIKKSKDVNPHLYGPCFRSVYCNSLLDRKYKNLHHLKLVIPTGLDTSNNLQVIHPSCYSSTGEQLHEGCGTLQRPAKYKESFSGGPRYTCKGELGYGNSVVYPGKKKTRTKNESGEYANTNTALVGFWRPTANTAKVLKNKSKTDKGDRSPDKDDGSSDIDDRSLDIDHENIKLGEVKIDDDSPVTIDLPVPVVVNNKPNDDSDLHNMDGFLLDETTEAAVESTLKEQSPHHCSNCRCPEPNITTCIRLHSNGPVRPARALVPGNYQVLKNNTKTDKADRSPDNDDGSSDIDDRSLDKDHENIKLGEVKIDDDDSPVTIDLPVPVVVNNKPNDDSDLHNLDGFLLDETTEAAVESTLKEQSPHHCSNCRCPEHNITTCIRLHSNGPVRPARALVPGNYHIYHAYEDRYCHNQTGLPVELYALSDSRTNDDKLFSTFEGEEDVEDDDDKLIEPKTTQGDNNLSCSLLDISKDKNNHHNDYETSDNMFTYNLDQNLNNDPPPLHVHTLYGSSVVKSVFAIFQNSKKNLSPQTLQLLFSNQSTSGGHVLSAESITNTQSSLPTLTDGVETQQWMQDNNTPNTQSSQQTFENPTGDENTQPWMLEDDVIFNIQLAINHVLLYTYGELPVWMEADDITKPQHKTSTLIQYVGKTCSSGFIVDRSDLHSLILKPGTYVSSEIIGYFGCLLADQDPLHFGMVRPQIFEGCFLFEGGWSKLPQKKYNIENKYTVAEVENNLSELINSQKFEYDPESDSGIAPGVTLISIPIFYPGHWLLCIVIPASSEVIMLDTWKDPGLPDRKNFYTVAVPAFLNIFFNQEEPKKDWSIKWVDCAHQTDSDCGVFVCAFMYLFAVFSSDVFNLTKTLLLVGSIDQDFLINHPVRHQIALSILTKDIDYMDLRIDGSSAWYPKQVILGRKFTRRDLGLTTGLLLQPITNEKATITYPFEYPNPGKNTISIQRTQMFLGSILTTQEFRGHALNNYCSGRAHRFKKVQLDHCDYIRVKTDISLYEQLASQHQQSTAVTRQVNGTIEKMGSACATDSIIDIASYWIMRNESSTNRLFFPVRISVLTSWTLSKKKHHDQLWKSIQSFFPNYFRVHQLLSFGCIAFPFLRNRRYSVMFVMNLSSFWEVKDTAVPHICIFDSGSSTNKTVDKKIAREVREFLNQLIKFKSEKTSKKASKKGTCFQVITLNDNNLPLYYLQVHNQKDYEIYEFESRYYVITYIAIMYRKVVFGGYKGLGSNEDSFSDFYDKDKCLLIMKDILLLFNAINNVSIKINTFEQTSESGDSDDSDDQMQNDDNKITITSTPPTHTLQLTKVKSNTHRRRRTLPTHTPPQKQLDPDPDRADFSFIRQGHDVLAQNRISTIRLLKLYEINGNHMRCSKAATNKKELMEILNKIRRYRISIKVELNIPDFLQSLLDRQGCPDDTKLLETELKQLIFDLYGDILYSGNTEEKSRSLETELKVMITGWVNRVGSECKSNKIFNKQLNSMMENYFKRHQCDRNLLESDINQMMTTVDLENESATTVPNEDEPIVFNKLPEVKRQAQSPPKTRSPSTRKKSRKHLNEEGFVYHEANTS